MKKQKIEKYYRNRSRELVDLIHDKGFFAEDVSRKGMRILQDYIAYLFQSNSESAIRADRLIRKLQEK